MKPIALNARQIRVAQPNSIRIECLHKHSDTYSFDRHSSFSRFLLRIVEAFTTVLAAGVT